MGSNKTLEGKAYRYARDKGYPNHEVPSEVFNEMMAGFAKKLLKEQGEDQLLFAEWMDVNCSRCGPSNWTYRGDLYKENYTTEQMLKIYEDEKE